MRDGRRLEPISLWSLAHSVCVRTTKRWVSEGIVEPYITIRGRNYMWADAEPRRDKAGERAKKRLAQVAVAAAAARVAKAEALAKERRDVTADRAKKAFARKQAAAEARLAKAEALAKERKKARKGSGAGMAKESRP